MPETEPADYTLWRAYVPRWSYLPWSGEGAARFGGRWNPVGAPTIYAALELSTAWAEYNQGFVQHPALIAQLKLHHAVLADLTNAQVMLDLGIDAGIHTSEWRSLIEQGLRPPTYDVRDSLVAKHYDGVIYPSFMSRGGACVALWRWNGPDGPFLELIDPEGRMPMSPRSWT